MKKGLTILLTLMVLTITIVGFTLFTSTGLSLVATTATRMSDGLLTIGQAEGTLFHQWDLKQVEIRTGSTKITAGRITCTWQLMKLLKGVFHIAELRLEDTAVTLLQTDETSTAKANNTIDLPSFVLPLGVTVEQATLSNGILRRGNSIDPLFQLTSLTTGISIEGDNLQIDSLNLESPEFTTELQASAKLSDAWPMKILGTWGVHVEDLPPAQGSLVLSRNVINPEFSITVSQPIMADIQGSLEDVFANLSWNVRAVIEQFNLPDIKSDLPTLTIETILESSGDRTTYAGNVAGKVVSETFPPIDFNIIGNGDLQSLQIKSASLQSEENRIDFDAFIDWNDGFSWQSEGRLAELNLAVLTPQVPGNISLGIRTEGSFKENRADYHVVISDFIGLFEALNSEITGKAVIDGNEAGLKIRGTTFDLDSGSVEILGEIGWTEELSWDMGIGLFSINPTFFKAPVEGLFSGELRSRGSFKDNKGKYHLAVNDFVGSIEQVNKQITGEVRLEGNEAGLQIERSQFNVGDGSIELMGDLRWAEHISWDAGIHLSSINPRDFNAPVEGMLSGELKSSGSVKDNKGKYHLAVNDFVGTIEQVDKVITGEVRLAGNESGLQIERSQFNVGDGSIELMGEFGWAEHISWDAGIHLSSINPRDFNAPVTGMLNGDLKTKGSVIDSSVDGIAEITGVSGVLAGYDLSGGGTVSYRQGNVFINDLFFKNGENNLEINGEITDRLDLVFTVNGSELTRLVPSLSGTISAQGTLAGTREQPDIMVNMQADHLSYQDYAVEQLSADILVVPDADPRVNGSIEATTLEAAGQVVERLNIDLDGSKQSHRVELTVDSSLLDVRLNVAGGLDEELNWDGSLKFLKVDHPRFGSYQSLAATTLHISDQSALIEELCIASESLSLCTSGAWKGAAEWEIALHKISADLDVFNRWSLIEPEVVGQLVGNLQAYGDGPMIHFLDGELINEEVAIEIGNNDYYDTLKWIDNTISVGLSDTVLKVDVASRFHDGSFLKGRIEADQFGNLSAPMREMPFSAQLQLEIKDVSPLKVITSSYLEPKGYLDADLDVSGTIEQPRIEGNIVLEDGEIFIPQLNIRPNDIILHVDGREDAIILDLQATSGEGTAQAKGAFTLGQDRWDASFEIKGTNVQVMNKTDINLVADPDILLSLGPDGGSLNGTIEIPRALIQPDEMSGSVSESSDVIIVGEEDTGSWPFIMDITISLGNEVRVDGYGVTGALRGGLDISNSRQELLTGLGTLNLEDGLVSIFERELEIARGRLMFDGGPVDNPGVDVRAQKTIKGERLGDQDVVVGVNLIGTVEDFEIELFSIPPMDDADIVSYIVTGTSLQSGGGSGAVGAALSALGMPRGNQILGNIGGAFSLDELRVGGTGEDDTSLTVGKRLTDDLSISYDFNLHKNSGFFTIRYDFGRGFSVESRNSMLSNAVNLLYSFER